MECGHYVTYKRTDDGRFFQCNDAVVREILDVALFESRALVGGGREQETPFILIYERVAQYRRSR